MKWIIPATLGLAIVLIGVPALACGGHSITASNDAVEEAPAEEAVPTATTEEAGESPCNCDSATHDHESHDADSETELTNTAPTGDVPTCGGHGVEAEEAAVEDEGPTS